MRWRQISALDCYSALFGVFLLASPWLFAYSSEQARIDIWVGGAAVTVLSIAAIVIFAVWEEWLNLLLGLWLVLSPWVLGFSHTRAMHVSVGLGALVTFVAALELWLVKFDPRYGEAAQSGSPEAPGS